MKEEIHSLIAPKNALPKRTLNLLHLETFSLYCVTAVPCSSEIKTSYLAF